MHYKKTKKYNLVLKKPPDFSSNVIVTQKSTLSLIVQSTTCFKKQNRFFVKRDYTAISIVTDWSEAQPSFCFVFKKEKKDCCRKVADTAIKIVTDSTDVQLERKMIVVTGN